MNFEDPHDSQKELGATKAFFLVLMFGVLAILSVYIWGFPVGADFDNHFRFALPLYDEIAQGNYFPGWLAESNYGFGDARFRFYPPFLYYLLCFFRYFTNDWYYASLIVFTLLSILGAAGVYFWARNSFNRRISVVAAALYAFVPYHVSQFYQASLLAEFAAASILPFAFLFVEKLTTSSSDLREKLFNIAALAASYSLIVTTHLPSTVVGSLSLGIFALILIDWKNNKKALFFCALAAAIGLLASAWFCIKMIAELDWIAAGEKVSSAYYDYRNNFVFSPFAPANLNTFYGSFVAALTIGLFAPSIILWRRFLKSDFSENIFGRYFNGREKAAGNHLRAMFWLALISFFMTTDLSRPVWAIVPKLKDVQFPYRWLTVSSAMICPLAAFSLFVWIEKLKAKNFRAAQLPIILVFLIACFLIVQSLMIDSTVLSRADFNQHLGEIRGARSFHDWLPRGAKDFNDLEPLAGKVDAGNRKISVMNWQSLKRNFTIEAGNVTRVRLRSYFYPLWQASVKRDGQKIPIPVTQAEDGTLLLNVSNEAAEIEVEFVEPSRTKLSYIASLIGWLAIIGLLFGGIFRRFRRLPSEN